MKAKIILLLCFCFIQCGQTKIADNIKDGEIYDCVLLDKYRESTPCGIFKVAEGLKFRVADTDGEFVALIECPGLYEDEFFKRREKYSLQLTSDVKKCDNCLILNRYKKSSLPTYYALKVAKAY